MFVVHKLNQNLENNKINIIEIKKIVAGQAGSQSFFKESLQVL